MTHLAVLALFLLCTVSTALAYQCGGRRYRCHECRYKLGAAVLDETRSGRRRTGGAAGIGVDDLTMRLFLELRSQPAELPEPHAGVSSTAP